MGTGKVPTLDVWGRGGKLRSQFRLGWNCNNFSRFLFYLTSNKAVRSWGQEGAEGSQNSGGQLYSFIQWEGGEQQNKARKASFPSPRGSLKLEQRCGEGTRGEMNEGLLGLFSPQWSCLGMMGRQPPIWEDLFISCHGNNRTMTQPHSLFPHLQHHLGFLNPFLISQTAPEDFILPSHLAALKNTHSLGTSFTYSWKPWDTGLSPHQRAPA